MYMYTPGSVSPENLKTVFSKYLLTTLKINLRKRVWKTAGEGTR